MNFLALLVLLLAVFTFVKSVKFRKEEGKPFKSSIFLGVVLLFLSFVFWAASGGDDDANIANDTVAPAQTTDTSPSTTSHLDITPAQFRKGYDSAAEILGISTRTDSAGNVTSDVVSVRLNTSEGFISNAVMAGAGDGTAESGVEIMSSIIAVIMATSPELNENGRNNVMRDLGLLDEGLSREQKTATVGNVKYSFMYSDEIGSILTVNPAK